MRKHLLAALAIPCIALLLLASCNEQPANTTNGDAPAAATQAKNNRVWKEMKSCPAPAVTLPPQCQDQANCDDNMCLDSIRKVHEITADSFNAMRHHYDSNTEYAGKSVKKDRIQHLVNAASAYCGNYRIFLDDGSTDIHNENLTFSLQIVEDKDRQKAYYSVALFKAILNAYPNADSVVLYKAAHADGCRDIIFTVMVGSEEVYFGDVSDTEP